MFCTNCGNQVSEGANFCVGCGSPVKHATPAMPVNPPAQPLVTPSIAPVISAVLQAVFDPDSQPFTPTFGQPYVQPPLPAPSPNFKPPPAPVEDAPSGGTSSKCSWCGAAFDGDPQSCPKCGAILHAHNVVTRSGWGQLPGRKDMAKLQFGNSVCQIEGAYVPVADMKLAPEDSVYFAHHVLLWKDPQIQITTMSLKGGWKRLFRHAADHDASPRSGAYRVFKRRSRRVDRPSAATGRIRGCARAFVPGREYPGRV